MIFSLFSLNALADEALDICYTDINQCVLTVREPGKRIGIYVSAELLKNSQSQDNSFISFQSGDLHVRNAVVESRVANYKRTEYINLQAEYEKVEEMGGDFAERALGCGFALAGCGLSIASMDATFGLSYWVAKVACSGSGVTCAYAKNSYDKWQKAKKKSEPRSNPTSSGAGNPDEERDIPGVFDGGGSSTWSCTTLPATLITSSDGGSWKTDEQQDCVKQ